MDDVMRRMLDEFDDAEDEEALRRRIAPHDDGAGSRRSARLKGQKK